MRRTCLYQLQSNDEFARKQPIQMWNSFCFSRGWLSIRRCDKNHMNPWRISHFIESNKNYCSEVMANTPAEQSTQSTNNQHLTFGLLPPNRAKVTVMLICVCVCVVPAACSQIDMFNHIIKAWWMNARICEWVQKRRTTFQSEVNFWSQSLPVRFMGPFIKWCCTFLFGIFSKFIWLCNNKWKVNRISCQMHARTKQQNGQDSIQGSQCLHNSIGDVVQLL